MLNLQVKETPMGTIVSVDEMNKAQPKAYLWRAICRTRKTALGYFVGHDGRSGGTPLAYIRFLSRKPTTNSLIKRLFGNDELL